MKRILIRSLAIVLSVFISLGSVSLFTIQGEAVSCSGVCGEELSWTFNDETDILTITGTGAMDVYPATQLPWKSILSEIKSVDIGSGVTEICDYAFYGCDRLETVSISESVSKIGAFAFSQCLSLAEIKVDGDNLNYEADKNGVLFTKGKTELVQYPANSNETAYSVPDSVKVICDDSFRHSESLTEISLPEGLEKIGDEAFYASGIETVNIPASVSSTGKDAFGWCFSLESIFVDDGNSSYSSDEHGVLFSKDKSELIKFPHNSKETAYIIPDGVVSLADNSFENCHRLNSVKIPASVITIGNGVFFNCSLGFIAVDSANQNYSNDEHGVLFTKDKTELIQYPLNSKNSAYIIPEGTLTVKNSAFHNAENLERVVVAESVASIEANAFFLCDKLEYVHIPETTTEIGEKIISNGAYICSESENCFAKEYATVNQIPFRVCNNHKVTGITLSDTAVEITNKQTYQLAASVDPDSAADRSIEWSSDNTAVAIVDNNGLVTAVSAGKATVTAKAVGGYTASCNITVNPRYFTVTWISDGNENVQSVAEGAIITIPSDPAKTGYSFNGWTPDVPDTMPAKDLSFKATWKANSCNAVFNANGGAWADGSTYKTHSVDFDSKIYTPRNPVKQGYVFEGWTPEVGIMDDVNGKEFSAVWSAATDTKYTVETYTMKSDGTYAESVQLFTGTTDTTVEADYDIGKGFELNAENSILSGNVAADGSLVLKVYIDRIKYSAVINGETIECLYGSEIAEPEKPDTPEGHSQQGWVDENGNSLEFPICVDENLPSEIKPNFVKNNYTVTWIVDGNEAVEMYKYADKITIPLDPQKTGYTFTGWTPEIPDNIPDSDLEFTATWSANSYVAVFDANSGSWSDGTLEKTFSVPFDSEIKAPESPAKPGYIFTGWTPEVGMMDDVDGKLFKAVWVASAKTVYTVETYTMTTDGSYSVVTQTFTGTTDTTVNAGYTVGTGFVLNTEKSILSGTVYADNSLVLKAYIDRQSYTVTTVSDGTETSVSYLYGAVIPDFVQPEKHGYTFIGWDKPIPDTMPAEDLVFNAIFEKTKYTCSDCGDEFDDEATYGEHLIYEQSKKSVKISIRNNPGSRTIKYGETLRLTAVVTSDIPVNVKWYVDGVMSGEGTEFDVNFESGTRTVTAEVVEPDGTPIKNSVGETVSDSEKVSVNSGFFQRIVSFFKKLFKVNMIVEQ